MDKIPVRLFYFQRIDPGESGSVIYQAIQTPEPRRDVIKHPANFRNVFEVGLKNRSAAALFRGPPRVRFRSAVMDCNKRALSCQPQRYGTANALACARDQNHFPVHTSPSTATKGGSGSRPLQLSHAQPTAVMELTAPATAPI